MERFIINNGNFEGIHDNASETQHLDTSLYKSTGVNDTADTGASVQAADIPTPNNTDATQVVKISQTPPQQPAAQQLRSPRQTPPAPRRAPAPRQSAAPRRPSRAKQRKRITLIAVCALVVVILIGAVIAAINLTKKPQEDNGLILPNVFAAGVNLGGMTPEEAKGALENATADTFSVLDMSVTVLDTEVLLKPSETGAKLNIEAVVNEAYNYGRTGTQAQQQQIHNQAATKEYQISLIPHLNLNIPYIQKAVSELGNKYSSTLAQPNIWCDGDKPTFSPDETDITKTYETLHIFVGTAEYGLNTKDLYQQIMDAYNSNIFQVVGQCTVTTPDLINLEEIYNQYCTEPTDAELDTDTYEVTPERYGYGFDLEAASQLLENAIYGTTIDIPMFLIKPDIVSEDYDKLFRDELAAFYTSFEADTNLVANLKKACAEINGLIIKADEIFSFNEAVGQPTVGKGFKEVEMYVGTEWTKVLGGGMSQVASNLYYCAMVADLEIIERVGHTYAPDFINTGYDAYTQWDGADFRFRNTTEEPIRIEAKVQDGYVIVRLIGTDTKDYTVQLETETVEIYQPSTLIHIMEEGNKDGYLDGDVLVSGITGFDICTYRCKYDKTTGDQLSKDVEDRSHYSKRNEVIVEIERPVETEPSEPTDATDPTGNTSSTEPTGTSDPTEPSNTKPSTTDPTN